MIPALPSTRILELQKVLIREPCSLGMPFYDIIRDVSECDCLCRSGYGSMPQSIDSDYRNLCENAVASAIRQFFPQKRVKICSIGPGQCLQEVVVHALACKMREVVDFVLVDGLYAAGERTGDAYKGAFKPIAQALCPQTTVTEIGGFARFI